MIDKIIIFDYCGKLNKFLFEQYPEFNEFKKIDHIGSFGNIIDFSKKEINNSINDIYGLLGEHYGEKIITINSFRSIISMHKRGLIKKEKILFDPINDKLEIMKLYNHYLSSKKIKFNFIEFNISVL